MVIVMREYILTLREREIIKMFLEKGLRLNGFNILKLRMTRALPRLEEDMTLIKAFLKRLEET